MEWYVAGPGLGALPAAEGAEVGQGRDVLGHARQAEPRTRGLLGHPRQEAVHQTQRVLPDTEEHKAGSTCTIEWFY